MAYGKRISYQNKTGPSTGFISEMNARAADWEAEERKIERMVDGRPFVRSSRRVRSR